MDGPSSAEQSYLARPFVLGTRLILAHPLATISIALLLAVLASGYSAARLGYRANRLDLVNPNSETTRFWNRYSEEFGDKDDAVVVVEGASRAQIIPVIDELADALSRNDRLLHSVLHRVDLVRLRSKGLYYLPADQLQAIDNYLQQVAPIVSGEWSRLNVGRLASDMLDQIQLAVRQQAAARSPAHQPAAGQQVVQTAGQFPVTPINPVESLAQLNRYCDSLADALQRKPFHSPWPSPQSNFAGLNQLATQYMISPDGRFGFITLRLKPGSDPLNPIRDAASALREIVAEAGPRHPEVRIGLTGLPIMEDDEMTTSQSSMLVASLISFVGVAILFIAGFGGVRHALLANAILVVGMAWSFAFATATVGHLNILSVTFTATLIGIGIDYGVYYCARYLQLRKELDTCEAALLETSRTAGPAIAIGALTTAISFFAAGCTTFVGVSELGIIAGGGILLCAVAELTLLPAAICLVDRSDWGRRMPEPLAVHTWIRPMLARPRLTLTAGILFTLALAGGLHKLWYDNNLLNMQAVGLESVELERRLLEECHQSSWYALSLADSPEQLLERKAAFDKLPTVERTEEIVSLIPSAVATKRPLVERISGRLTNLPDHVPLIPVERRDRLVAMLARLQQFVSLAGPQLPCARQLGVIRGLLERLPAADSYALLSRFQQQAGEELLAQLRQLREVAGATPPDLSDLPPTLVSRFVGQHGKHLLRIYGRGNIWDTKNLARFVHDVQGVDPQVTGNPLQAHGASLEMRQSFQQAALYSLAIIIVVLWLDFRNWRHALLAALPLGVGVLETFGALGWLNIPLNPANMIALPLILGIGVDYGVHIVHEFRERQGPYRMSPGTAVAVLVDALTTIMGYGALMAASHQGLQSLGRVLTLAVTFCLFTSLILLPALLTWATRNRPVAEPHALPLDNPRSLSEIGASDEPQMVSQAAA